MPHNSHVEDVELHGHIIDSLLLPKTLDVILSLGGSYVIRDIRIGERQSDPSYARIEVRAPSDRRLEEILAAIHDHGARLIHDHDCVVKEGDVIGAFPDGFYCSTNFRTQVRVHGHWIDVQDQEMDVGILIAPDGKSARCIPMHMVQLGDRIVIGRHGVRVFPPEIKRHHHQEFEFMNSAVSSEKPKGISVREIAASMKRTKAAGEKILAVLGPAVIHTGGSPWVSWLIHEGYLDVLFAGNALATHDMEQSMYGTSLGVSMERGTPTCEGHEHHLRTINTLRRLGGIPQAVAAGVLKNGIMFECVQRKIPYVLAGSIRDDGPIPDVITDSLQAQMAMRKLVPGVGFCLMVATTLHSIATGNLLPAWVKVACVDISPATVTKLLDRGSSQTIGVVSDAEPFLRLLVNELKGENR